MNAIRENNKVNTAFKKMQYFPSEEGFRPPSVCTWLKSLLMFVCHKCLVLLQGLGEQTIGMKHFQEALKLVLPSCLRSSLGRTELSPVSWEQIGGLEEVKLKLRQVRRKLKTAV